MKRTDLRALRAAILIALSLTVLSCSAMAKRPMTNSESRAESRRWLARRAEWTNGPWSGDDRPFAAARNSIKAKASSGESLDADLEKLTRSVTAHPDNALNEFCYYYTMYQKLKQTTNPDMEFVIRCGEVDSLIVKHSMPHTYNFSRIAFLCSVTGYQDPMLIDIAKRLVAHDPSDYVCKYQLVNLLLMRPAVSDKLLGLKYAQEIIKSQPNKSSPYAQIAFAHYELWQITHKESEARSAIATYHKYLQLVPNTYLRSQFESFIAVMQKSIH